MLGQVEGFHSAGEVRHVWARGFVGNQLCGCRRPFRDCPFWSEVVQTGFGGFDQVDGREVRALQRTVDHVWHIPGIAWNVGARRFRTDLVNYLGHLGALYRAMREVSGARVIIDSSKGASHAFLLRSLPGVRVWVIHMVRDSRAVAHSWQRTKVRPEIHWRREHMPRLSPVRSSMEWDALNLAVHATRFAGMPYVLLRYEDFVREPRRTVERLLGWLGRAGAALDFLDDGRFHVGESHTVSGNPARFEGPEILLRPDVEWESEMGWGDRLLVTSLTMPLLARYGYVGRRR